MIVEHRTNRNIEKEKKIIQRYFRCIHTPPAKKFANISNHFRYISNYYCNDYQDYATAILYMTSCIFYAKKSNQNELDKLDVDIIREKKTILFYNNILEAQKPNFGFFS